MKHVKRILAVLNLLAFAALFAGPAFDGLFPEATGVAARTLAWLPRVQLIPAILSLDLVFLLAPVLVTLAAGRFCCEALCPLGAAQDLVRGFTGVRRVCTRLPETRAQRLFRWAVFAVALGAGCAGLGFLWLEPYGLFGRAASLATLPEWNPSYACFAGGGLLLVLVLRFVGKGRFWCNWVCPAGTLYALLARLSFRKDAYDPAAGCARCRACLAEEAKEERK